MPLSLQRSTQDTNTIAAFVILTACVDGKALFRFQVQRYEVIVSNAIVVVEFGIAIFLVAFYAISYRRRWG